jgi:hypothetical protein
VTLTRFTTRGGTLYTWYKQNKVLVVNKNTPIPIFAMGDIEPGFRVLYLEDDFDAKWATTEHVMEKWEETT